jgi:hypothetical protein
LSESGNQPTLRRREGFVIVQNFVCIHQEANFDRLPSGNNSVNRSGLPNDSLGSAVTDNRKEIAE